MGRTGDTILTVVEKGDHAIRVHVLASVELVVLEVADDLLRVVGGALLEGGDTVRVGLGELGLDGLHVALRVDVSICGGWNWVYAGIDTGSEHGGRSHLEICQIGLFVELGRLEAEGVDDVVDLLGTVLNGLILLLLRRVRAWAGCQMGPRSRTQLRTNVDVALLDDNHLAVNLVDSVVDELAVCIRVSTPIGE